MRVNRIAKRLSALKRGRRIFSTGESARKARRRELYARDAARRQKEWEDTPWYIRESPHYVDPRNPLL